MLLFSTKLQALKFVVKQSIFAFCLLLGTIAANAQSLTNAQQAQLRTAACADVSTGRPAMLAGDAAGLRIWLNGAASPTFVVWRTAVSRDDVTGDGFDWTQVDNLTTGQARIWELLFQTETGRINFASAGKRAAISETWKGTAAKVAVGVYVLSQAQRPATVAEKVLATGTGSSGSPGTMTWEGSIDEPTSAGLAYQSNGQLYGCP